MKTPTILKKIIFNKKKEIVRSKKIRSLAALRKEAEALPKRRNDFLGSLKRARPVAVIAEIKRRSPSKGLLTNNFNPVKIAAQYKAAGASALSILTDRKFFGGSDQILKEVRKACSLPILRKDFILEDYQVYESRLMGADAILLIARILSAAAMKRMHSLAKRLGLEVVFEVHNAADMKKAASLKPRMIGINNRDLSDFHVDLGVTRRLAPTAPRGCLLISESGIRCAEDLTALKRCGVKAVLVGETLMREKQPGGGLKRLMGKGHGSS